MLDVAPVPEVHGHVHKIEGPAGRAFTDGAARLVAVVDDDDPDIPSAAVELRAVLS
ncbi:MAG TPA: hypothetical protein VK402_08125 [Blastococcus sp.]|nr:hypothetical protein [Blastococcus sp.]